VQAISRGLAGQSSALLLLFLAALPAAAQIGSGQLQQFRQEAEAFNRQDPFANAYRAGHYNGYLAGVLDSLQGRSVCFKECICEIDKLVERQLADHPEMGDRPVAEWLLPLLEQKFPCK
jgi:hypothetical protein